MTIHCPCFIKENPKNLPFYHATLDQILNKKIKFELSEVRGGRVRCAPGVVKNGFFRRSSDSRTIQRFRCLKCRRSFSLATGSPCFNQKKRRLNPLIWKLLNSAVSRNRIALVLKTNRRTVTRKLHFLAEQAEIDHARYLAKLGKNSVTELQFDEVETFERSKCLPLSIPLAVTPDRKIIAFEISKMPAKHPLFQKSVKKYGPRPDERDIALDRLFKRLEPIVHPAARIISDRCPRYPAAVESFSSDAVHISHGSRRARSAGDGELKRIGFDPLFAHNHTAAMLRYGMSRLLRRTWCTTKTEKGLRAHLWVYLQFHNRVLTAPKEKRARLLKKVLDEAARVIEIV